MFASRLRVALGPSLFGLLLCAGYGCKSQPPAAPPEPEANGAEPVPSSPPAPTEPEPKEPSPDGGDPLVGLDGMFLPRKVDPLDVMVDPLEGPFESPEAYLLRHIPAPASGCQANKAKATVAKKSLVGRRDILELMLFRSPAGDTCTPEEHCHMAIRTERGWWIGARQCTGAVDATRAMTTADTTLRWAEGVGPPGPLAIVEYTVTIADAKSRKPINELRWMRLCGLDGSKEARCTRPALTGCTESDGSRTSSKIKIRNGGVILESNGVPGEACGGHEAFLVGDFDVTFSE